MLNQYLKKSQIFLLCGILSIASSIQPYEQIDDHGGSGECALLLEGPGRSSAFDYNLNTLRGTPSSYGGPQTCITYDAVNNAYIQARKYVRVVERRERYQHEELATVGELVLEVSRILARTYGLTVDEIEHGLPLIDTSKTLVREICPAFLSNVHCQPGKYRRYDGLCNNLQHPTWGAVQSTFARLLKPVYADYVSEPRVGHHGSTLPPPRIVSRTIHPDEGYHDHAATILLISWGQFMDHDLTLTATPLDPVTRNEPEECCHRPPNSRNPYCLEIGIPHDDPFYGVYGVRCIDFVRGFPGVRAGCRLGSRNQFNILTAVIDGNTVYGVEENFARSLRSGYGGLLRMNPVFAQYGLHDLLPLKLDIPDEGCTRPNRSMYCFDAGEIRVNEQLVLTCMHTLMAREHNRVAHKLGEVNPHWDDETLYQEGRRIVIGEIQHITYNEFLPLVLGKEVMAKFGLLLQKEGYWDGYDANVNPSVLASFSAAAFRFGHSLLPTNVERWSKAHKFIASRRLRDLIRQPFDLYRAGVIDEYFMGMANQVAQAMDDSVTQEVTNHLFRKPGQPFGVDLAAFNMQRGREFGLPSYMEYRKYCGLPGAEGWDDLFGSMNNITVKRYAQIYVHPQDIDLWSGGVSERPLPGAMVGPTFACIIATQFSNARRGDRFWYELGGTPHSFTIEQLAELRKARLARIVCDNTDIIDTIQLYPMVLPDHEINPRVPCRSGVLLNIDLSKWADYGGAQYTHQSPIHTDSVNLHGYENDPGVGKYVNQDGLQQLRHYLKVGPYRTSGNSHHQQHDHNPFFGYLRQVLTRRPVHYIHSTKGHDASNIANVHYSPHPEHDELPAPGVDHSPRGYPIHPPNLAKVKPEAFDSYGQDILVPVNKPIYGPPQLQSAGWAYDISKKTGGHHHPLPLTSNVLAPTNNNNYGPPNVAPGVPLGYVDPVVQPAVVATAAVQTPLTGYGAPGNPGRAYGAPNLPFGSGPLSLHYGFQPVSSPYGNVSSGGHTKRYGQEVPQYVIEELARVYQKNNYKRSTKTNKAAASRKLQVATSGKVRFVDDDDNATPTKVAAAAAPVRVKRDTSKTDNDERRQGQKTNDDTISIDSASSDNESPPSKTTTTSDNKNKNSTEDIMGIRASIMNAAFDLMTGLTELSFELVDRIRHTAEFLPFAMTSSSSSGSTSNRFSSSSGSSSNSSPHNNSPNNNSNNNNFNVTSSYNNLDSHISKGDDESNQPNNVGESTHSQQSSPSPSSSSASTSPNVNPLNRGNNRTFTDPRKILVRKATSFVTSVLKDVSKELNRRIQNS